MGYNFYGNYTISTDPAIHITKSWVSNNNITKTQNNKANSASRGVQAKRWPIKTIVSSGFAVATLYYGDIDPDKNDLSDGAHALFYDDDEDEPYDDEWGAVAAWSWGYSRALDYLEVDQAIDATKVIVLGHSRHGKSALWAAATDSRFAMAVANNSGCGGAALFRRKFGETIEVVNRIRPHWFCTNFKNYNQAENDLPIDQHQLISLIAPRPVYVASAKEDYWADPKGEFLGLAFATPIYMLYGKKGLDPNVTPQVNKPISSDVAYHVRTGKHDLTKYDWEQFIRFAKAKLNL